MIDDRSCPYVLRLLMTILVVALPLSCQRNGQELGSDINVNDFKPIGGELSSKDDLVIANCHPAASPTDVPEYDADVKSRIEHAMTLFARGELIEARQEFAEIDALEPLHPAANFELGNIAVHLSDLAAAEARYRRVLQAAPNHIGAHERLAQLLSVNQQLGEATLHWRAILDVDPDHERAKLAMARNKAGRTHH